MTLAHRALILFLLATISCGDSGDDRGKDRDDASADDSAAEVETGCANWDNWSCDESAGGCGATCGDGQILCNSGGTCNIGWGDGSCDQSGAGTGCEICEAVVEECGEDL